MRQAKSVRWLLMMNAALLVAVVWMLGAGRVRLESPAFADGAPAGMPNAADQRLEMIRELRRLSAQIADLRQDLKSAQFDVNVKTMPRVRLEEQP